MKIASPITKIIGIIAIIESKLSSSRIDGSLTKIVVS